jgi:proteasome lid subunit RPN8/RPN11
MIEPKISQGLLDAIHAEITAYGRHGRETGLFLLAPRDATCISHLAFAGTRGITRRRGLFTVSASALARLFRYAREQKLMVAAQLHSHEHEAFLSDCDLQHGFAVERFISAVIPDFKTPPRDPRRWGWWQFSAGCWQARPAYGLFPGGEGTLLDFDEDGVRAR